MAKNDGELCFDLARDVDVHVLEWISPLDILAT
jgi:hypothetical protein